MVSIISPVYNEAENLHELCRRIIAAFDMINEPFEIILVDNGSEDDSLEIIKNIRINDGRIKYLSLSRNFGHQGAILAGLKYATGEAVISLDGDLQHPPEIIPDMIRLWRQGYEVVFTYKKNQFKKFNFRILLTKLFYIMINTISDLKLSFGQSDFRLLDRKIVNIINQMAEKDKFIRGLVDWVGFGQTGIEYEPPPRKKGISKFSLRHYMAFALNGAFSFSTVPLRLSTYIGILMTTVFGIIAIYYVILGLGHFILKNSLVLPPGWLTIVTSILFLGGIQLMSIGIIGEYIGRIFMQTKSRPEFIVREQDLG
jgi:dolichol-phosphate mannosyltransferase